MIIEIPSPGGALFLQTHNSLLRRTGRFPSPGGALFPPPEIEKEQERQQISVPWRGIVSGKRCLSLELCGRFPSPGGALFHYPLALDINFSMADFRPLAGHCFHCRALRDQSGDADFRPLAGHCFSKCA